MEEIKNGSNATCEAEGRDLEKAISELREKDHKIFDHIFDATVKLDNARIILIKLVEDYGFTEEFMPTFDGVYGWLRNNGGKTEKEKNSMTWIDDYEFIQAMLHVLLDHVCESREALMACNKL